MATLDIGPLDELPDDYRRVLQLHHRDRLTFEEIGMMMNRPPEVVRRLWARAIEKFRKALGEMHGSS